MSTMSTRQRRAIIWCATSTCRLRSFTLTRSATESRTRGRSCMRSEHPSKAGGRAMPIARPSGQKVRVTFSVRRPKTSKGHAKLQSELEKFVKKHGGKLKKKTKAKTKGKRKKK